MLYFGRTSGFVRSERFSDSVRTTSIVGIGARQPGRHMHAASLEVRSGSWCYSIDTATVHRRLAARFAAIRSIAVLGRRDAVWTAAEFAVLAIDGWLHGCHQ